MVEDIYIPIHGTNLEKENVLLCNLQLYYLRDKKVLGYEDLFGKLIEEKVIPITEELIPNEENLYVDTNNKLVYRWMDAAKKYCPIRLSLKDSTYKVSLEGLI